MTARDDVLARVRQALVDVPPEEPTSAQRAPVPSQPVDDLVELFTERVGDYRASVRHCSPGSAPTAIAELIPARTRGQVDLAINGSSWVGSAIGGLAALLLLDTSLFDEDLGLSCQPASQRTCFPTTLKSSPTPKRRH